MATQKLPSDNPGMQAVTSFNQHKKGPYPITAIVNLFTTRFLSVNDPGFQHTEEKYQASTPASKAFYLIAYLLPGIIAYLLINIQPVYDFFVRISGLEGYHFQYYTFVIFTLFWHMLFPVFMLRKYEKLSWKEVFAFLSLDRFSFKEILFIAPLAFGISVIVSLPYMLTLYTPFQQWLSSIPLFQIPSYSIFASYEAFYGAPAIILVLMMIGNFVGEEIYFRGYLMKKTAFLGRYNWIVNSTLFCVYHLWQIPQTFPLIVPILFFGLTMQLRKNLYTLIMFHLLFNLAGVQIYQVILGLGTGAH
ncbi:MAG: CPBP family intramembrane metalloprotease [Chitinophagaceae bacterium]|nr:MAG: CPBP family intramembrane metalloprotease [Chitinophagaceae bacterium]